MQGGGEIIYVTFLGLSPTCNELARSNDGSYYLSAFGGGIPCLTGAKIRYMKLAMGIRDMDKEVFG
jgi:hypothetical protein